MNHPALVVFDFDGTLAQLPVDWAGLRRRLAKHFRLHNSLAVGFEQISAGLLAVREQLGNEGLREAYAIIEEFELRSASAVTPHPRALDVLDDAIHRGAQTAIFSNNMTSTIRECLTHLGRPNGIGLILGRDSVRYYKPHPEGLQRALSYFHRDIREAVFVGDSDLDSAAAVAIGMRFVDVAALKGSNTLNL